MIELASALRAEVNRAAAVLAGCTDGEAGQSRGPGMWGK